METAIMELFSTLNVKPPVRLTHISAHRCVPLVKLQESQVCLQSSGSNFWVKKDIVSAILCFINRKIETSKRCDVPRIVTKPNRNWALQSGSFCQEILKAGDGQV